MSLILRFSIRGSGQIGALEKVDNIDTPAELKEIGEDFRYPYDTDRIVKKVKSKAYRVQE